MVLAIIAGVIIVIGFISTLNDTLKRILEIVSKITRLLIFGGVAGLVIQALGIEFSSQWMFLLALGIGTAIVFFIVKYLSLFSRLVCYSINFLVHAFALMVIAAILGDKISVNVWLYGTILFLYPRILWISDRRSKEKEYSHSKTDAMGDVTQYYIEKNVDIWEDDEDSWNKILLQIGIAFPFYAFGSMTIVARFPIQNGFLLLLYAIIAASVNVVFDMFVFKKIDKKLN